MSHKHLPNSTNPVYSSIPRQEFSGHNTYFVSYFVPDTLVSIRDDAMLQHQEFKIHRGQIGDSVPGASATFSKQIDEGIKEGYTESEIIRGVFCIIKPGNFKDMVINKDFFQSHLGESSSTELFQNL